MRPGLPFLSGRRRSVLSRAVARWRAGNYSPTLDALVDESGNRLHARFGSSVGPDTNDPLRLRYRGIKEIYFPGAAANLISTPDSAAFSAPSALDVDALITPSVFAAGETQAIVSHWFASGSGRAWIFQLSADGGLRFAWSTDGTSNTDGAVSTSALPLANGSQVFVRLLWNSADGAVRFYYKLGDTDDWTQWGTTQSGPTVPVHDTSTSLRIGATGSEARFAGLIQRVNLRTAIDGPIVASFDARGLIEPYTSANGYTDPQGNVWTLSRSAIGRKLCVVDRDLLLLGTDDYLEIADSPLLNFGAAQNFTLAAAYRKYGDTGATAYFVAKKTSISNTVPGWRLQYGAAITTADISNGAFGLSASYGNTPPDGRAQLTAGFRRGGVLSVCASPTLGFASNSSLAGDISTTAEMRVGRLSGSGTGYADMEFFGAAVFREALTVDQLKQLAREMGVAA